MKSCAPVEFWSHFDQLPESAQRLARKNFKLVAETSAHPSLHFKRLTGDPWSARVGDHYRAVARKKPDHWMWFWIGSHEEYNHLARRLR